MCCGRARTRTRCRRRVPRDTCRACPTCRASLLIRLTPTPRDAPRRRVLCLPCRTVTPLLSTPCSSRRAVMFLFCVPFKTRTPCRSVGVPHTPRPHMRGEGRGGRDGGLQSGALAAAGGGRRGPPRPLRTAGLLSQSRHGTLPRVLHSPLYVACRRADASRWRRVAGGGWRYGGVPLGLGEGGVWRRMS